MKRKSRITLILAIFFVLSCAGVVFCFGWMLANFSWTSASILVGSVLIAFGMTKVYKKDMIDNGRA